MAAKSLPVLAHHLDKNFKVTTQSTVPVPVAARSKASVCGRSSTEIVGSNPTGGIDVCVLLSVVCCQVEVTASGLSLVQRSPIDCCASSCVM